MPKLTDIFAFPKLRRNPDAKTEVGVSGVGVYGGYLQTREKNPKLTGTRKYLTFEDIATNVSIVAASVRYFVNLGAKAKWSVEPAIADTDRFYADIVEQSLESTETSWSKIIRQSHMHRFEGFSVQEMTADKPNADGLIFFRSIEKRPAHTIKQWDIDATGRVNGFIQESPLSGESLYIPRWKTIYLVDDLLTDSPEGLGLFRHCVEPALRLRNLQQLEETGYNRDLRGIPVGRAPLSLLEQAVQDGDLTEEQRTSLLKDMFDLLQMQRKGEDTSIMLDSMPYVSKSDTAENITHVMQWGIDLLSSEAPGLKDISQAQIRVQQEIARLFGTESLLLGSSGTGSLALAREKADTLMMSVNSINNDIKDQFNKDYLDLLWKLNAFPDEMKPQFKIEEVGIKDAEIVAKVIADMAAAGAILDPSDPVIQDVRELLGVSRIPEEQMEAMERMNMAMVGLESEPSPVETVDTMENVDG